MPLHEIPKNQRFTIGDNHKSAASVLYSVLGIADGIAQANVAIVLNVDGNYYTYGFEPSREMMLDCATALTEWARQLTD